jgi:ClpP class serine protease
MPVGPYDTFDECVAAIQRKEGVSEESARKICGKIEKDSGGSSACGCKKATFSRPGPVAILQAAFGLPFEPAPRQAPTDGVVDVRGPLAHQDTFGCLPYEAVVEDVRTALASDSLDVVLRINSPGGDVFGVFEAARAIRAAAAAAGKRLVAYVNGQATSAAYVLACAADEIVVPSTGVVGSIGVIDAVVSAARQDAAMGVDIALVTSGERKADGHPHGPLTADALEAAQKHVDELAAIFYAWVAERRPLSVDQIRGMQAGLFVGQSAVAVGLADRVADFLELRGSSQGGTITATARPVPRGSTMSQGPKASKYTDAMAALAALAEDGDEDAKKAMKKMLAPAAKDPDKDGDVHKEPDGDEAEGKRAQAKDGPNAESEKKDAEASTVIALAAELASLKAQIAADAETAERKAVLASRPDLANDPNLSKFLAGVPIATFRAAVASIPQAKLPGVPAVNPLQGDHNAAGLPPDQAQALKVKMGLAKYEPSKVTFGPQFQAVFGGSPEQVERAILESRSTKEKV